MSYAGVWFRGDVRLTANPAVSAASKVNGREQAIPALLLICPQQMKNHDWAPIKWDLLRRHLEVFAKDAAQQGILLSIEMIESWSMAAKAVKRFAQHHELTELHFNTEYPVHEQRRDRAVTAVLEEQHIKVQQHHGSLVVPPVLTTQAGKMYQKFTPFAKAWREYVAQNGLPVVEALPKRESVAPAKVPVVDYPVRDSSAWPVGEAAVRELLTNYVNKTVCGYADERDIPGLDSTSRLSPYWELGILSPWQAVHLLAQQSAQFPSGLDKGADTWLNELIWREFYLHLMKHVPRLSYGKAFLPHTDAMQWRNNETEFDAWCRGETGYPIVDAGMRQLAAEGWMHNRVRMIVAHFLVKDLMIDWRWGEQFFMQHLIDGSFAANNGGWQWSASTGTDAAPYFRVFNPTLQSEKVDPDGTYIRKWVKQLEDCPAKQIHAPAAWLKQRGRDDYPAAIVNHKQARERFLAAFKAL
ncbi:deoxyribodipyrimidine photo-lyase [Pseudidiomarina tainanensis]|uniref:Deoxyribodipyrimidine photo-lyase n=1 Tax=Pseudidiomarina tainanensis TaxID=502365 RepID=A0ACD2HKM1_9GAMM|nr:FAD-binding domain-containing protein [Pseudidiomarina tainanensis]RZQ56934.1 deoxyribodipyrimidine photo-lyase [Pseudidiomarina tainanensis]